MNLDGQRRDCVVAVGRRYVLDTRQDLDDVEVAIPEWPLAKRVDHGFACVAILCIPDPHVGHACRVERGAVDARRHAFAVSLANRRDEFAQQPSAFGHGAAEPFGARLQEHEHDERDRGLPAHADSLLTERESVSRI
nr:hypothetical protein [Burkholderia puraquae]